MPPDPQGVRWLNEPEERHVCAAESYLRLLTDDAEAHRLIAGLHATENVTYRATDLLRASGLDALPLTDSHVARDLILIHAGTALSPVLLVRGSLRHERQLTIADGYHRICAAFQSDTGAEVACRIVDLAP